MWMQDCSSCTAAKENGLQAWMRHLTEHHVVPTEWPSERVAKLTGPAALRPYTMITESKKKRRKDTVPRPLNSFMLFAQHVRRNVLRVFSDASNSVISQQLGDLWRTVQQECRTQYDEEANCLVKIHQLEFPNYKYQPKKRHVSVVHHASSVATSREFHPITTAKVHSSSLKSSFDTTSSCSISSSSSRPRLASVNGTVVTLHTINTLRNISDVSKSLPTEHLLRSSPQKHATAFKVSSTTSKFSGTKISSPPRPYSSTSPISSTTNNNNKQSLHVHSLSSVLPPLLTASKQLQYSITDPFQFPSGSCDSAYASGINSSSSSSASSPVVGDLISPNKNGTWNQTVGGGCSKSSPIRRRLQFVPIRPQSHHHPQIQLQQTIAQPVRQRFLSANNGILTSSNEVSSAHDHVNRLNNQVHGGQLLMSDEVQVGGTSPPVAPPQVHQLTMPIYVKLNSDNSTNEDVILALPPGTTIIQSLGDLACLPRAQTFVLAQQTSVQQQQVQSSAVQLLLQQSKAASVQPPQLTKVHGCSTNQHQVLSSLSSNQCSPLAYSSSTCSSSAWSPLSTEVFFPTQQCTWSVNSVESDITCQSGSPNNHPFSPSKEVSQQIDEPPGIDIQPFEMELDIVDQYQLQPDIYLQPTKDRLVQPAHFKMEEINSLNDYCSITNGYTKTEHQQQQDRLLIGNFTAPLAMDTLKQASAGVQLMERDTFSMSNSAEVMDRCDDLEPSGYNVEGTVEQDDNFDCSLDAMMNSIDITTFLPGTFSANEEQLTDAYIDDATMEQYPHSNIKCDVIDLCNQVDEVFPDSYFTTTSADAPTKSISTSPIHSHLQHSPLADLDSLDKSSLFVVKPELSFGVCTSC